MTKTELEQQQHNAICATLDALKEYGYLKLFDHRRHLRGAHVGNMEFVWDALSGLEAAARAGGADYNDI